MNDDQLSTAEHDAMRSRLLAGTKRIKPAGAHRRAIITSTVAVVLVAGLAGTAIGAANFLRMGDAIEPIATPTITASPAPVETRTPSATPAPTASESTAPASLGVMPFAGQCSNALDDDAAARAAGQPMQRSDFRWETGSHATSGGIDCVWVSTEEYLGATVHVYAYPDDVVPDDVRSLTGTGCEPTAEGDRVICDASGVTEGIWVLVRVVGWADQVSADATQAAYALAAAHVVDYPEPKQADPTSAWWGQLNCDRLPGQIDAARYGFDRVTKVDYSADAPPVAPHPSRIPAEVGAESSCDLSFTSGEEPDVTRGSAVGVSLVPGGAVTFATVESAERGQRVEVVGALSAMWVPGLDRYEGSWNVLAVSDGVNVLMLSDGGSEDVDRLILLAEELLPQLG